MSRFINRYFGLANRQLRRYGNVNFRASSLEFWWICWTIERYWLQTRTWHLDRTTRTAELSQRMKWLRRVFNFHSFDDFQLFRFMPFFASLLGCFALTSTVFNVQFFSLSSLAGLLFWLEHDHMWQIHEAHAASELNAKDNCSQLRSMMQQMANRRVTSWCRTVNN